MGLFKAIHLVYAFLVASLLLGCTAGAPATPTTPPPAKPVEKPAATAKPAAEQPKPEAAKPAEPKAATPAPKSEPKAAKPATDPPLNPPVTIKMGTVGSTMSDAGFVIADAKGYLKEQGLALDTVVMDNLGKMVPPLATGEMDVGGSSVAAALFNAVARGVSLKVVADKGSTPKGFGFFGMSIRKDLMESGAIKTAADLKGKNIATSGSGTFSEIFLAKILKEGGLTPKDVNVMGMGFADMPAALSNKSVDTAQITEPVLTRVADQGLATIWKRSDEVAPGHQIAIIVYSEKFAATEAAKRFMVAYVKGLRDYNDAFTKNKNKDEIVNILATYTKVSAALVARATPAGLNPDGYVNGATIKADQDYFVSTGDIKDKVDVDKVVDNQFVEYAIQKLGKYN